MNPYETVIQHYGRESQKRKAIEELQELIDELKRDLDTPAGTTLKALLEEIADVANMNVQLCWIYGFSRDDVRREMQRKMQRTLARIEKEKEANK